MTSNNHTIKPSFAINISNFIRRIVGRKDKQFETTKLDNLIMSYLDTNKIIAVLRDEGKTISNDLKSALKTLRNDIYTEIRDNNYSFKISSRLCGKYGLNTMIDELTMFIYQNVEVPVLDFVTNPDNVRNIQRLQIDNLELCLVNFKVPENEQCASILNIHNIDTGNIIELEMSGYKSIGFIINGIHSKSNIINEYSIINTQRVLSDTINVKNIGSEFKSENNSFSPY